jgi:hypothetical protein
MALVTVLAGCGGERTPADTAGPEKRPGADASTDATASDATLSEATTVADSAGDGTTQEPDATSPSDGGGSLGDTGSFDDAGDGSATDAPAEAASCVYPAVPPSSAAVLQFHKNATRDGVYVDPTFTLAAAKAMRLRLSAPVTGQLYAQPLYVPDGPNGRELFVAATEANHVTGIDACGKQVWDRTYGAPAAFADLPCGNIYPTLGITGTPVIDATARVLYFDAMTQTGSGGAGLRHLIHAISIDDGSERAGWPVDVSVTVPGFDSSHQNQRGALTLLGGVLYVPYGGHFGDCGQYYGWILGVPVSNPAALEAWRTIGGNPWDAGPPLSGGAFWAPGGLPTDGTSLFAVSGNTMNPTDAGPWNAPSTWVGGEAVFRLDPGPTFSGNPGDYFYPAAWQSYDDGDSDLGGVNAVLVAAAGVQYLLAIDKVGVAYVLDPSNLGGNAGPLATFMLPSCAAIGGCGVVGSPAVYTTSDGTYVAIPERDAWRTDVVFLAGSPPVPAPFPSKAGSIEADLAAPMVTTPNGSSDYAIWTAAEDPSIAVLHAFDGTRGGVIASVGLPDGLHHFNPPIAANGRLVVPACGDCVGPPGVGGRPVSGPTASNGQLLFVY